MSGIEKLSTNISEEVEIPLGTDDNSPPKIVIPKHVIVEPEYYECNEKYTIFE
jgi:hypothetical protein